MKVKMEVKDEMIHVEVEDKNLSFDLQPDCKFLLEGPRGYALDDALYIHFLRNPEKAMATNNCPLLQFYEFLTTEDIRNLNIEWAKEQIKSIEDKQERGCLHRQMEDWRKEEKLLAATKVAKYMDAGEM